MSMPVVVLARDKSTQLLNEILALPPEDQVDVDVTFPVTHYFGHKVYLRHMFFPKGYVGVGRIHKFKQIAILLSGEISLATDNGPVRLKAPCIMETPAGTQRVGYAHEDSVFLTVHGSEKVDPNEMLDELTVKTFEEFDQLCLENKS